MRLYRVPINVIAKLSGMSLYRFDIFGRSRAPNRYGGKNSSPPHRQPLAGIAIQYSSKRPTKIRSTNQLLFAVGAHWNLDKTRPMVAQLCTTFFLAECKERYNVALDGRRIYSHCLVGRTLYSPSV